MLLVSKQNLKLVVWYAITTSLKILVSYKFFITNIITIVLWSLKILLVCIEKCEREKRPKVKLKNKKGLYIVCYYCHSFQIVVTYSMRLHSTTVIVFFDIVISITNVIGRIIMLMAFILCCWSNKCTEYSDLRCNTILVKTELDYTVLCLISHDTSVICWYESTNSNSPVFPYLITITGFATVPWMNWGCVFKWS